MSFLDVSCRHCGQSARRLMLVAMLQDAGAQTNTDTDACYAREDGGEHEFASVDTHPKGGDGEAAPFMGSAVPKADAQ